MSTQLELNVEFLRYCSSSKKTNNGNITLIGHMLEMSFLEDYQVSKKWEQQGVLTEWYYRFAMRGLRGLAGAGSKFSKKKKKKCLELH